MSKKAVLIEVGQAPKVVEVPAKMSTLKFLQEHVGGYICTAFRMKSPHPRRSIDAYCNDEGLLEGLPLNLIRPSDGAYIVGNVVIMACTEDDGETHGLTQTEIKRILAETLPMLAR